jgi:hypothetical protein
MYTNTHVCGMYHLRFIPEGVAEASQTFLRNAHFYQNYVAMSNLHLSF